MDTMELNGIILILLALISVIIVLGLIFHSGFRKDLVASEGEANIMGISVKGIAPVVMFIACLAFIYFLSPKPDEVKLTNQTAINQLKNSTKDIYTASNINGEFKILAKYVDTVDGTVIGILKNPPVQKEIQKLDYKEMYDLSIFYNKKKPAKSKEYIFKLFSSHPDKIRELSMNEHEKLALTIKDLGNYNSQGEIIDSLIGFIDQLSNQSKSFRSLRQAELYYNAGINAKNDEWKLDALKKYFEHHKFSSIPEQNKEEAIDLFNVLYQDESHKEVISEFMEQSDINQIIEEAEQI